MRITFMPVSSDAIAVGPVAVSMPDIVWDYACNPHVQQHAGFIMDEVLTWELPPGLPLHQVELQFDTIRSTGRTCLTLATPMMSWGTQTLSAYTEVWFLPTENAS